MIVDNLKGARTDRNEGRYLQRTEKSDLLAPPPPSAHPAHLGAFSMLFKGRFRRVSRGSTF